MDRSLLVRIFSFPVTLIHGDALVVDRWRWLIRRLPRKNDNIRLLEIGCGTGAFSIGLALKGYDCLGLSWDEENQREAARRAKICKADTVKFEVCDIRFLDKRQDLFDNYDIIVCLETIEHIINDQKLMHDMSACLKKDGKLFLTAPYYHYVPIGIGDNKEEAMQTKIEDGRHVRVGYTEEDLMRLCKNSNLQIDEISFCSGFLSQKITYLMRCVNRINHFFGWLVILPLRILPLFFDEDVTKLLNWQKYSICLVAHKV